MPFLDFLFGKKPSKSIIEIERQIKSLEMHPEILRNSKSFSLSQLAEFTEKYVQKLINKYGLNKVQLAIDNDGNPRDPIINYITCLMEISMLHELFKQSFASSNNSVLSDRLEYLAWSVNVCVANNLKDSGVKRIPALSGNIYIYYTWDNMETIIERIYSIAAQIDGADPKEISSYIDGLIRNNL